MKRLRFLLFLALYIPACQVAATPEIEQSEVGRALKAFNPQNYRATVSLQTTTLFEAGTDVALPVSIAFEGLEPGIDIYLMVLYQYQSSEFAIFGLPAEGYETGASNAFQASNTNISYRTTGQLTSKSGEWLATLAYVDVGPLKYKYAGGIGNRSVFSGISSEHHPIYNDLDLSAFEEMMRGEKNVNDEEKEEYVSLLEMAYVATSNSKKADEVSDFFLKLSLPSIFYYDAVTLIPVIVKRQSKEITVIYINEKNTNRLSVPITPPKHIKPPKPPQKNNEKQTEVAVANLKLQDHPISPLTIGRHNTIDLTVEYESSNPNTDIYLMFQPLSGDKLISIDRTGVTKELQNVSFNSKQCNDPNLGSDIFEIPGRSITTSTFFLGKVEAAYLGSIKKNGVGQLSGKVSIKPPPLGQYYDGVRVTPLAVYWEDGQQCTIIDSQNKNYIDIKLLGR